MLTTVTFSGVGGPNAGANLATTGPCEKKRDAIVSENRCRAYLGGLDIPGWVGRLAGVGDHQQLDGGVRCHQIGGGTGANGMTLTFASPTSPHLFRTSGRITGLLGHQRVSAVGLANFKQGADPSADFVGIADGGPVAGIPNWVSDQQQYPNPPGGHHPRGGELSRARSSPCWMSRQSGIPDLRSPTYRRPANLVFHHGDRPGLTDNFVVPETPERLAYQPATPEYRRSDGWAQNGNAVLAGPNVSLT